MHDSDDEQLDFFRSLPAFDKFLDATDPALYHPVPASWSVVLTDVKGSTAAIEAGRYKDVNALGVASIVAVRNALSDLDVPYVFGGDGATLLAPESRRSSIAAALRGVQRTAERAFDLELRAAIVPLTALYAAGHELSVARYQASTDAHFAMLAGDGLLAAERWLKSNTGGHTIGPDGDEAADLSGFECRWLPIPSKNGKIVSLLVLALAEDRSRAAAIYRSVLDRLDAALAGADGCPVTIAQLQLDRGAAAFEQEARIASGHKRGLSHYWARQRARFFTRLGRKAIEKGTSVGTFDGRDYRRQIMQNSDFRKFDETLRMVIDVGVPELGELREFLEAARAAGHLVYGIHEAPEALMTCVVRSYDRDHVHFIDGAHGGYALAAKQLKAQLKKSS
jgi:hypothetical protein